jgi:hypothetical protein
LQSIPAGHGQSRPVTVIFDGKVSVHANAPGVASARALMKSEKSEKSEKSIFPIFQSEHAVTQFVPNKIEGWMFSDFPKIFRGYGLGVSLMKKHIFQSEKGKPKRQRAGAFQDAPRGYAVVG